MHQGRPKIAQPASKVSPSWTKMGPPGATFAHFGGIFSHLGIPLCIFMHFYKVLVNTCAFSMKSHGKHRKIQQIAVKMMNIAQKHIKSA